MPDVTRSDSQRSDTSLSLRPRVSFNRDVHVKRIVPRESSRVAGALSGDGAGHLVASPVRKERLNKSKKELAEEAARILQQADNLDCITQDRGVLPEKFYTLPNRKSHRVDYPTASLDRKTLRRNSVELALPPKKPPRTFATLTRSQPTQKTSIFDVFKKTEKKPEPKKSNLRRSVSDASNLKSKVYGPGDDTQFRKRAGSETEESLNNLRSSKKQLSPIIEDTQRDDYFSKVSQEDKENKVNNGNVEIRPPIRKKWKKSEKQSVTDQLREYIDEVDEALYKETGVRVSPPKDVKVPEVVIIDVDKAEKISGKKSKLKNLSLGKKLKSITKKSNKINDVNKNKKNVSKQSNNNKTKPVEKTKIQNDVKVNNNKNITTKAVVKQPLESKLSDPNATSPKIREAIATLERQAKKSPTMIHSSQLPPEKLPLTKGRTVDSMVKRLSNENSSPPPKANVILNAMQHTNNQPFSYTRGLSPEKYMSNENLQNSGPASPGIIYAQVVCGNGTNGPTKQTVHTTYANGKKHLQHSDSDEGLGYEENFNKKYENNKTTNDHRFVNRNDSFDKNDFFNENDKYEEESPITPKFRNTSYNGFSNYDKNYHNEYTKTQHSIFVDSSSRGRGDGMDSKRRESLTEPIENGFPSHHKVNGIINNGRSDISARRDLLESRINRRITDKNVRVSPEYGPKSSTPTNVYVSETTSKYYKSGSTSPVGYKEKYVSETKPDKHGVARTKESRSRQYFGDNVERNYDNRVTYNNSFNNNEPKSFDSQISDYRSSPENRQFETSQNKTNTRYINRSSEKQQKISKDRDYYKSNPEIHHRINGNVKYEDSYHDSLRREKHENRVNGTSKYRSERYLDQNESERKDKFGDSGIENDFRRDSGDNFKVNRPVKPSSRRDYCNNESEDEGFASSLLIASERQHTEDNFNQRKNRRDYDSDRAYSREDDPYRHLESMDYRSKPRQDYVPRERSIDDGSHYDPRIDKDFGKSSTLKKNERKPPKPEKKSGLEKVKQLFTRDSKKKKEKAMVRDESLRARYTEYKGSRENLEPKLKKKESSELNTSYDYSNRRRLSTPSPSPTRDTQRNGKSEATHGSWFKSLDRLSRKKTKKDEKEGNFTSTEEETPTKPTPTKNLRFFGDTDLESNDSVRHKPSLKTRPGIINRDRTKSQSSRDLHNISEELHSPEFNARKSSHKSMLNISEAERERDVKGSRVNLKPPMSPNHRTNRDAARNNKDERMRRRKNEVSSVESSTEGDSSQQSQRSIVYLHAATVGDIPGPGYLKNGRRAASREELTSNGSSRIQPQVKTLSRSFSVLAPWKPRHYREGMDIDYTQYPKPTKNGKYEQRVSKNGSSRKENSSTLKKKAQETRRTNQSMSTLTRKSKSKENVSSQTLKRSREELSKGSSSTLYKKKERLPRENSRYSNRDDKKISSKSMSVESLGSARSGRRSNDNRDVSRSVSMPRDPEKSAGWFKMSKKTKAKSGSTQRL